MDQLPQRRWFTFRLRILLLATAAAAYLFWLETRGVSLGVLAVAFAVATAMILGGVAAFALLIAVICRFRFRLRTLLIMVVPACAALAWVSYSREWVRKRHEFSLNRERSDACFCGITPNAPALLWMFGEDGRLAVQVIERDRKTAKELFPEATILVVGR